MSPRICDTGYMTDADERYDQSPPITLSEILC